MKRVTTKLGSKHLRQVQMYAVNEGVEWVLLTNRSVWQAWHLTGGLPVLMDLALEVDLLGPGTLAAKANELFFLSVPSLRRRQIDELWQAKKATSPVALAAALRSDAVLMALRRELRRDTGHLVEVDELRRLLDGTVLRPECLP